MISDIFSSKKASLNPLACMPPKKDERLTMGYAFESLEEEEILYGCWIDLLIETSTKEFCRT